LAERGGRRFSQAISEGDGISVIVEVDGPETARTAEADGAEGVVVRGALAGLRDATELPILWRGGGTPEDAMRAGADAVFVVAEEHDEDGDGVEALATHAAELGLDLVVSVSSEEVLERVLELHDPETFHLATNDLERALELLTDVPVGKLAIAEANNLTREQVVELERRGMDAVIVPARNVAELVGGAPPAV
jgi:indole-3-glycerol phosphate synthase